MSTRTYTMTFAGAATLTAPGGVFFYVKSAAAALTITTRGSTTAPIEFVNVGAGLRFGPVSLEKRWTYLDITSAVAQVVELVVSDDGEVDIASTVTVAGSVTTTEALSAALATNSFNILTATQQDLAANPARRRITLCAPSTNTGSLFIRGTDGATSQGIELQPGLFVELKTGAAIRIRNDSGATQTCDTLEET